MAPTYAAWPIAPDHPVTGTVSSALDSGPEPGRPPITGGSFRVRPKGLHRHVAELDALVPGDTLVGIIGQSRAAIDTRLHLARLEVVLNVARSTAQTSRRD